MNIFIAGLNVPKIFFRRASEGLSQITNIYVDLKEGKRFEYNETDAESFILMSYNKTGLLGKRNYIAEDNDNILFYSGLPIDPLKKIQAHRAEELLKNFDKIKYDFEGQASIIRFNKKTKDVDIITDTLGMEQVYYYNKNNEFLISNSVYLLQKAINISQLDSYGVSYFLSFGWVASDNTLIKDIRVIKGGQHWVWKNERQQIDKITYFDPSDVKVNSKQALKDSSVKLLAQKMSNSFSVINENFEIECPLTGGFDSRLVAAFLIHEKINAEYYTTGNPLSKDFRIALQIAKIFNLPHKSNEINGNNLIEKWDDYVYNFIIQNDGLASLWGVPIMLTHSMKPDRIKVRMTTAGSEAARITFSTLSLQMGNIDKKIMHQHFYEKIIKTDENLINADITKVGEDYLYDFIDIHLERNVDIRILPDLFYVKERVGRHVANNWRIEKSLTDNFNVFCGKDFLVSAMEVDPLYKIIYPLHYKLMKLLNKRLMDIPFYNSHGKIKFDVQNLFYQIYSKKVKDLIKRKIYGLKKIRIINRTIIKSSHQNNKKVPPNDRIYWFERKLNSIRSFILDQPSSELWFYLNKNEIEKALLNKEDDLISRDITKLYIIATLFYYEYYNKQLLNN